MNQRINELLIEVENWMGKYLEREEKYISAQTLVDRIREDVKKRGQKWNPIDRLITAEWGVSTI